MQIEKYIRIQAIICAIINILVNPALSWLVNRKMEFMPLWGENCIVVDTAITLIIMPLLVALFTAAGVRKALKNGQFAADAGFPRAGYLLSRLPENAWGLGIMIGLGSVLVFLPLTLGLFHVLGISGLLFAEFALFKAFYTGSLAFLVTRWVIIRQLKSVTQASTA